MKRKALLNLLAVSTIIATVGMGSGERQQEAEAAYIPVSSNAVVIRQVTAKPVTVKKKAEESIKIYNPAEDKNRPEITNEEANLIVNLCWCEAGNQDLKGKELVIKCVFNRIESPVFPNSVKEVIFQNNQFTPAMNGAINSAAPDQECWQALMNVLNGWDESEGCLYFESIGPGTWHWNTLEFQYKYGGHYFYK